MAQADLAKNPNLLSLSPRDLLLALPPGETLCRQQMVPVKNIDTQGAIFDKAHAIKLGELMQGEFGITQAALVRARFKDETKKEVVYDWMDGLHRIKGQEFVHPDGLNAEMKCEVLYGCTDETLFKQRIVAADNVKSIRFARICMFINDAWQITPWRKKISATKAFYLAVGIGSGKQMINDGAMIEEIKKWAIESAKAWNLSVGTIYQDLMTFDIADPDLVVKVRSGSSFQKGEMAITPRQLGMIAEVAPHQKYPGVQMLIANYVNNGISTAKLSILMQEIKELEVIDKEMVMQVISDGKWKQKKEEQIIKPVQNIITQEIQPEVTASQVAPTEKHTIQTATPTLTSVPTPEQATIKNAMHHLREAKIIVTFSKELSFKQKGKIEGQIDSVILQLGQGDGQKEKLINNKKKTEPKSEQTKKANRSVIDFMKKWMVEDNLNKLANNGAALDEFKKEIAELSNLGICNIAKLFFINLISGDEKKRMIAINIFDKIPFISLDQFHINNFFADVAKQVKEGLVERDYHQEQIRDILGVLLTIINQKFVSNRIGMTAETETLLFDALKSSASYLQNDDKEEIETWIKNHHFLLLVNEEK